LNTRIFKKAEDIPMVEDVRCKLMELLGVVGSKGKRSKVVDGLASSLIYSQGGEIVVKVTQNWRI